MKLKTLDAVAMISLLGGLAVLGETVAFHLLYDETSGVGLRPDRAGAVYTHFAPVVIATLMGLRNYLFAGVSTSEAKGAPAVRIHRGAGLLYASVAFGCGAAALVVLYIAYGRGDLDDGGINNLLGVAAGIWTATLGYIFSRFMKERASA